MPEYQMPLRFTYKPMDHLKRDRLKAKMLIRKFLKVF